MIKQFYFLFLTSAVFFFSSCGTEPNIEESVDEESLITEMSIVGEEVSYQSDSVTMKGYIAYDETDTTKREITIVGLKADIEKVFEDLKIKRQQKKLRKWMGKWN